jgi:xanthine dehydrogenase accessory factor
MSNPNRLYTETVRAGEAAARAVLLRGTGAGAALVLTAAGAVGGTLGSAEADAAALPLLLTALAAGRPLRTTLPLPGTDPALDLFIAVYQPPERLIIVGAVHTAIVLVQLAAALGFETIVIDNRTAFATADRFGHATRLITRWPADALADLGLRPSDSLVFLTHDEKIDNPALTLALASPVRYIGALGSRATHARRLASLREGGAPEALFHRIHAPIGLNLGGRTPEEIALAILAEVVQVRHARPRPVAPALP